ncbi:MAG TPA: NADH-quinone oxidoreductase subunit C [Acidimicrobiales bacterium]|nr:NADH-quinone oxidoreductase subunit C [Acidimicrobiales bacterium]
MTDTPDSPAGEPESPDSPAGSPAPAGLSRLHGHPVVTYFGATVVHTERDGYLALMAALKADGYDMCVGVTGVDYLTHPGRDLPEEIRAQRFEVVVELISLKSRQRVRVRCQVPAAEPHVPTLFDLWPGSEAHERETYDLFGITFDDHPDMTRILMPEDWEGHPLRKDYATGHIPVQFKEAPSAR